MSGDTDEIIKYGFYIRLRYVVVSSLHQSLAQHHISRIKHIPLVEIEQGCLEPGLRSEGCCFVFSNFEHLWKIHLQENSKAELSKRALKKVRIVTCPRKAETTSLVQTVPRGSVSASDTPVKGTLQRARVPEGTLMDASLGVEGTPSDSVPHYYLLGENRRDITGSESAIETVSVSELEVTSAERTL